MVGAEFVPMWRDTLGDDELRLYETDSDAGSKVLGDLRTRMQVSYDREPFEIEKHWVRLDLQQ